MRSSKSSNKPAVLVASIAAALFAAVPLHAANLTWDITSGDGLITGGTGVWDISNTNWTSTSGALNVPWVNANNDLAIFGGAAGTVTLSAPITVGGITFNTTGYTVTGNTLTLGGATPTITVGTGLSATISSVLAGSSGLSVGGGALVLNGISTFSGGTTVTGGTLTLGVGGGAGTIRGALTINSGATVTTTAADALGYTIGTQVATVNINGGTLNNAVAGNQGFTTNFVLTGGTMTSTGGGSYNFSSGYGISTLASGTTSLVSGNIVNRGGTLTFTTAQGTTASGIDLNVTGVISNGGGNAVIKTGPGTMALSNVSTYTGGTTVNGGTLALTGGGAAGRIRGVLTINAGATVRTTAADALGYTVGQQVSTININGGTFTNAVNANNGFSTNFVLTGGNITESVATTATAGINFDAAAGFGVQTLASATTSTISARQSIRSGSLTFNVAQGTTPSGIDLNVTGVIFGNGGNSITKTGAGTMAIASQSTYGGTTIVNNGVLALTGGGGAAGTIRGTVNVNTGATLRLAAGDVTGYAGGAASLNTININEGGTLNVSTIANQTLGTATLNLTGATVSGIAGSNIDLFNNGSTVNVLASANPSTISIPSMNLRQDNTQFNVADGAAASDLLVSAVLGNGPQGNHNLIKNGPGTMVLTGANTYSGTTTINAGTFALSGTGSLASPLISVTGGGVFDVTALTAGTFTIGTGKTLNAGSTGLIASDIVGNIATGGGLLGASGIGSPATLAIGGNLTLNGGTVNIDLANGTTVGSGVNDLITSTNLTLTGTTSLAINKLSGALVSSGSYTLFNYSGTLTGDNSNLTLSGAVGGTTRQSFALDTVSTPGSILLTVSGSSANLIWVGDGSANAWDIATTENWTGAADFNNKFYDGDSITIDDSGNNAAPISLGVTVQPGSMIVDNTTKDYVISGAGNIAGTGNLTKNGTGKLTIDTSNAFTGAVAINAGTVSVSTLANTGTASGLGAGTGISLGDATHNATLQYTGATATTNRALTLGDGGGTLDITTAGTVLTNSGGITGTGSLTKVGNGALTVAGAVATSGDVLVNAGALTVTGALSTTGAVTVNSGATGTVNGAISGTSGVTVNGALTLTGQSTYATGTTVNNGGVLTLNGANAATGVIRGTLTINSGGTVNTLSANALGYGAGVHVDTLNVVGGILNNTAVGDQGWNIVINLTNGGLQSNGGLSSAASTQLFSLGGSSSVNTFASATSSIISGRLNLREGNPNDQLPFNIEDGAAAIDLDITAAVTGSAATRGLSKNGPGLLQLSGGNTYAGATTINAGTLALGPNATFASTLVTINSGAFFDVSAVSGGYVQVAGQTVNVVAGGTLVGPLSFATASTLIGGTASPFTPEVVGNVTSSGTINVATTGIAGTLTLNDSLSLNSASLVLDLATDNTIGSGINDLIAVGGNLTLTGTTNVAVNQLGLLTTGTYTLINYGGALNGSAANFNLTSPVAAGRRSYAFDTTTTPGSVLLNVIGTPANLVWNGDNATNPWDTTSTVWKNGVTPDKFYNSDNVLIDDSGSNSPSINLGISILPGSLTVDITNKNYTLTGAGAVVGTTGLTKDGTGTFTIETANSFTGAVAINAGTISVASVANGGLASPLGAGTAVSLGDSSNIGKLQYTGATATTNRTLSLNSGGGILEVTTAGTALTQSGAITGNGSLTKVGNGALVLAGPISTTGNIVVSSGPATLTGLFSGGGGVVVDGGALTISAAETYTGGATINGGSLTVTTAAGTTGLGGGNTTVNTGGVLIGGAGDSFGYYPNVAPTTIVINGGTVTDASTGNYRITLPNLSFTGGTLTSAAGNAGDANGHYSFFGTGGAATITTNAASTTALISAGTVAVQSPTTLNVAAGSVTGGATPGVDLLISSNIRPFGAGTAGLTKTGNGTLRITGAQTYASLTNQAGRTVLDSALPNATITGTGGTLVVNANANNSTVNASDTNTTYFTVSQTLAALNIGDGGLVVLSDTPPPAPAFAPAPEFDAGVLGNAGAAPVPEPGSLALLLAGAAGLLGRRRRNA